MPMNYAKTALLLAVLTAILLVLGAAVGGKAGLVVAFAVALVMNVMSFGSPTRSCCGCSMPRK